MKWNTKICFQNCYKSENHSICICLSTLCGLWINPASHKASSNYDTSTLQPDDVVNGINGNLGAILNLYICSLLLTSCGLTLNFKQIVKSVKKMHYRVCLGSWCRQKLFDDASDYGFNLKAIETGSCKTSCGWVVWVYKVKHINKSTVQNYTDYWLYFDLQLLTKPKIKSYKILQTLCSYSHIYVYFHSIRI